MRRLWSDDQVNEALLAWGLRQVRQHDRGLGYPRRSSLVQAMARPTVILGPGDIAPDEINALEVALARLDAQASRCVAAWYIPGFAQLQAGGQSGVPGPTGPPARTYLTLDQTAALLGMSRQVMTYQVHRARRIIASVLNADSVCPGQSERDTQESTSGQG